MISVLVVDDSVVVRRLIVDALGEAENIEVVGTASNGLLAQAKIDQLKPDVITMDIEMPQMDGIEAVRELRKRHKQTPVIMFSTLSASGASAASPAAPAAGPPAPAAGPAAAPPVRPAARRSIGGRIDILAIGSSTGGPDALTKVLTGVPADLGVPIVITQHMPPVFTKMFAERLDRSTPLHVVEATDGMKLTSGWAYIAPGDQHLVFHRRGTATLTQLSGALPENSCRPAVDVMFRSVASLWGGAAHATVLTGMGQDGRNGAKVMRDAGAEILAQDEATSVVWGMPGAVVGAGLADEVLPLDRIAAFLVGRVKSGRSAAVAR